MGSVASLFVAKQIIDLKNKAVVKGRLNQFKAGIEELSGRLNRMLISSNFDSVEFHQALADRGAMLRNVARRSVGEVRKSARKAASKIWYLEFSRSSLLGRLWIRWFPGSGVRREAQELQFVLLNLLSEIKEFEADSKHSL